MVEIAISLAIIAFALVAIIGVLPLGLDVQKENRQETIINQDAGYFMDAIRNGARGLDDLTNYVFAITNSVQTYETSLTTTNPKGSPVIYGYSYFESRRDGVLTVPQFPLNHGSNIVGILSTPKIIADGPDLFHSNYVVAYVRGLSGSATEKFPQSDRNVLSLAFSYRMIPEVDPIPSYDTSSAYGKNLQANLNEVRLLFRWPLLPNWSAGNGRQVYRSLVGGSRTNEPAGSPLWFFLPTTFTNATVIP
jgi:type II secretory pathway pseudopilin PulG